MPNEEFTGTNNSGGDPQITNDDHSAFDVLADQIFTDTPAESTPAKPDVVQAPNKETPAETPKTTEAAQQPDTTVSETPEQKAAKEKAAADQAKAVKPPTQDKDLDAIQAPKNISPKSLEGWNAIRTLAKTRGEEAAALRSEVERLKPLVGKPDPAQAQELTNLKAELQKYQAIYQNERSPEFIEKYDKAIGANEKSGIDILEAHGLSKAAEGKLMAKVRAVGLAGIDAKTMTGWINEIGKVNIADARALEKAYLGNVELSKAREGELEQIKQRPQEFEQQQKQLTTEKFNAYTKQLQETVQTMTKDIPWAKMQEIPADASPETKARIEAENKFYQESEARFQAALYPKDAQTRAEVALSACLSFKLANDLQAAHESQQKIANELKLAQEELAAIKKAGVTSRAGINVVQGDKKPKVDTSNLSDDDAIEAGLNAIGA